MRDAFRAARGRADFKLGHYPLAALAAAERAGVIATVLHAVRNVHVGVAPAAVTDNVVVAEDSTQRTQRTGRMQPEAYHQDGFTPATVSIGPS
jgi:hypothetical protein